MTDRYAVIGNPIAQSKSPALHRQFARQLGHDISYEAILATPADLFATIGSFVAAGGRGMNVTAPFKLQVMELVDELAPRARAARAVNTLKFTPEGVLGDNTDGIGLVADIQERLGFALAGKNLLLIGAGGAARGVLLPLLQTEPASLLLVNRTATKAHDVLGAHAQAGRFAAAGLDAIASRAFDVVINASSASLSGAALPLCPGMFAPGALAYDLVYGSADTAFMAQARALGAARVADGLGMLVAQAAESYRIWRGVAPAIEPVMQQMRAAQV